jgi:hypothetical protein
MESPPEEVRLFIRTLFQRIVYNCHPSPAFGIAEKFKGTLQRTAQPGTMVFAEKG